MSWLKKEPKEHPQVFQVPQVRFCGEQDGPPERELKERLAQFFQSDQSVRAAYLANVVYGDAGQSPSNVALCLRTEFGPDLGLAEKVGRIFASMFGPLAHLDVVFLSDEQEAELTKACSPFFICGNQ